MLVGADPVLAIPGDDAEVVVRLAVKELGRGHRPLHHLLEMLGRPLGLIDGGVERAHHEMCAQVRRMAPEMVLPVLDRGTITPAAHADVHQEGQDFAGVRSRVERRRQVLLRPREVADEGEGAPSVEQVLCIALVLDGPEVGFGLRLARGRTARETADEQRRREGYLPCSRAMSPIFSFSFRSRFESHVTYSPCLPSTNCRRTRTSFCALT